MTSNKKLFALPVFMILGYLAVVTVNALSAILPINGQTPGEISDNLPNLFVPAGFTFSIWGVIYILLGMFVVYSTVQMFKGGDGSTPLLEEIGSLFVATCVANIMWIFTWHYNQVFLSLMSMVILFLLLLYTYLQLSHNITQKEFNWVKIPMSVYFGWITVATIANATAFLVSIGWHGSGIPEDIWTAALLVVATIIALIMLIKNFDIAYSLVIAWALLGITFKHMNFFYGKYPIILIICSGALTMIFAATCYAVVKTYKEN